MNSPTNQLLPIQANWRAAASGARCRGAVEFPLYSDADFIDEIRRNQWPYWFLNTVAGGWGDGQVQARVVVRLFVYTDYSSPHLYPGPTMTTLYHGGWIFDEIAALASLALGKRFKAGGISRRFEHQDEMGQPMAVDRRAVPNLMLEQARLVLPDVVSPGNLRDLEFKLPSVLDMDADDCIALMRAARLYQDALWIAESEPNLAWLMLVSALEVAAKEGLQNPPESCMT